MYIHRSVSLIFFLIAGFGAFPTYHGVTLRAQESSFTSIQLFKPPRHFTAYPIFATSALGLTKPFKKFTNPPAVTEALLVNGVAFNEYPGASILSDSDKALAASSLGHIKRTYRLF